jgi:hypothetical protein
MIGDNTLGTSLFRSGGIRSIAPQLLSYTLVVKTRLLKWVLLWGTLGLVISVLLLLRWKLTDSPFGQVEFILWPSSILTMGFDSPSPRKSFVVEVYSVIIAMNVVLYSLVGLLSSPLFFLVLRWRKRSPE